MWINLKSLARYGFLVVGVGDYYGHVWGRGMKAVQMRAGAGWVDGWSLCWIGRTEHRLKGNESEGIRISIVIHGQYLRNSIRQVMHTIVLPGNSGKKYPQKKPLASPRRSVGLHLRALNCGYMTSSAVQ
jgi:hypothetical protein